MKHQDLISKMTLEEKCYLLSGKDFWQSRSVNRLGIPNGGGIAIAGETFRGFHGAAGEWGHIVLNPQEKDVCNCGKRGCPFGQYPQEL